jgi:hypothetical protein
MNSISEPVLGPSTAKNFAIEAYKLGRLSEQMGDSKEGIKLRHSVRQLQAELDRAGISFHDLSGQPYDPGLSVDIVDCPDDTGTPWRIREMRLPIILWDGRLLHRGQVILEAMPEEFDLLGVEAGTPSTRPDSSSPWQRGWSSFRNAKRAARRKVISQKTNPSLTEAV